MEEDILRFIESDSLAILIAEDAANEIEELDVRKKRKRNIIQRCTSEFRQNKPLKITLLAFYKFLFL